MKKQHNFLIPFNLLLTAIVVQDVDKISSNILTMALVSVGAAFFGGLRSGTFQWLCYKTTFRIQQAFFDSITSQEIAFFDENKTGWSAVFLKLHAWFVRICCWKSLWTLGLDSLQLNKLLNKPISIFVKVFLILLYFTQVGIILIKTNIYNSIKVA